MPNIRNSAGIIALACCLIGCDKASTKSPPPPTKAQAQRMLSDAFAYKQGSVPRELTIDDIKCGAGRLGDDWLDGIPANTHTMVVPCHIKYTIRQIAPAAEDLSWSIHDAQFAFFYNDTGDYVFRLGPIKSEMCNRKFGCERF